MAAGNGDMVRVDGAVFSQDLKRIGLLKFEILAAGLRVSAAAERAVAQAKRPIRTRSGASGGLDVILPHDIHVNCPVNERFAQDSPLLLDVSERGLVIRRGDQVLCAVALQAEPRYYSRLTSDGTPMHAIGQMCSGDRFCYGMTGPGCVFWSTGKRCAFCSIGLNRPDDAPQKTIAQLLETLEAAVADPLVPARHILLGGGTTNTEDMGAVLAATLCSEIKRRFDISCYVMISAPSQDKYIDQLRDSGADELGMNLEFFSDDAWKRYIPGKEAYIGKRRYLQALEHAVKRFGPINTRSILVVGLEDRDCTVAGVETLASMGVMPILSPFRPLNGTQLEDARGFDHMTYFDLYLESCQRSSRYGIPIGPTCIACQNNTLALPLPGGAYRYY